jgi:MoaA/NifB/PqqE/SkfB family radical SAM enzyme
LRKRIREVKEIMEWSKENNYNSFNSHAKSLTYYEHYSAINDWRIGKRKAPLPPLEISLDLINTCQLNCSHCNTSKYLKKEEISRIDDEDLLKLISFFAEWGTKAVCFTGDTKVKLVNGTHKTFEELSEDWRRNKKSFEVYSRNEKGNIVPGIAVNPRKTQKITELIELVLDNNEIIKCTLDHKFMLRDGSYKEAKDLTSEDSLMPLYTKLTGGYEFIKDISYQGSTHKLFSIYWEGNKKKVLNNDLVIHHKNYKKLDNTRENIKQKTPIKKINTNKEIMLRNNRSPQNIMNRRVGKVKRVLKILESMNLPFNFLNYTKYRFTYSPKWEKAVKLIGYNHKIVSKKIIKLDNPIDVYCLTVEKYHNFALSSGVFVKNCFGGGGESTLHTKIWDALQYSQFLGMQNSIATNGINFNKETIEIAVKTCRWIGVSVDASNKETYQIGRKGDYFDKVIENLKTMVEISNYNSSNICDIAFKFLIFSYNQHEIYDACKLAKKIGVKDFHARPADFRHQGMEEWQEKQKFYDVELINKQFEECRKLEDKDFRVFCVTHKFNSDFTPRRNFSQCYASPICLQVNPNGFCFMCPDTRNLEMYKLGEYTVSVDKIKGFWGSKKHYDLVFNSGCENCKSRCTFGYYNEDFENLFIKNYDPLCRSFV